MDNFDAMRSTSRGPTAVNPSHRTALQKLADAMRSIALTRDSFFKRGISEFQNFKNRDMSGFVIFLRSLGTTLRRKNVHTVTEPSPAEGYLPWPGALLVGELAQVPHYPER